MFKRDVEARRTMVTAINLGFRVSQPRFSDNFDPDPEFLRVASSADWPRPCQGQQEGRYDIWVHIGTASTSALLSEAAARDQGDTLEEYGARGVQMDGRRCLDTRVR